MHFNEIPQFTRQGSYEVNMPISFIDEKLTDWETSPEMKLQLNPDFQRGHVWTEEQQIAFLEYFLKGGHSGCVIYFNNPNWAHFNPRPGAYNDFVCVDGLQRLTAIRRLMRGEIKVFGHYIHEFEGNIRQLKAAHNIKFNVNNLQSKKEVLQWYLATNTGGTPHTQTEIERVKPLLNQVSNG